MWLCGIELIVEYGKVYKGGVWFKGVENYWGCLYRLVRNVGWNFVVIILGKLLGRV